MSRTFLALCALLLGILLAVAANTSAIDQVDIPNVGTRYVWTPEEMDKLENILAELLNQRDKLTKQLTNCRAGT